jgi:hypothetical protein
MRSEMFGRRGREGWLGFTVLLEIFLSLACCDIAHDRSAPHSYQSVTANIPSSSS